MANLLTHNPVLVAATKMHTRQNASSQLVQDCSATSLLRVSENEY
jgi:hypothetical protein